MIVGHDREAVIVPTPVAASRLTAIGNDISRQLHKAGFTQEPILRQALALAEEVGEFVGALRRYEGLARRSDTLAHVSEELADVVITAFVTARELNIDLDAEIDKKTAVIYSRGWRE